MYSFEVQKVAENEAQEIVNFKNLYFHNQYPMEMAAGGHYSTEDTNMVVEAIRNGFILKVVETNSSTIVGFVIGLKSNTGISGTETDPKRENITKMLKFVEDKAKFVDTYNSKQRMHLRTLSVHPDFRGHKVGTKLLEASVAEAKRMGFDLLTVNCSNLYSGKIAANVGFELVSKVTFQEYNDHVGRQIFKPVEPHIDIKSYAMPL